MGAGLGEIGQTPRDGRPLGEKVSRLEVMKGQVLREDGGVFVGR